MAFLPAENIAEVVKRLDQIIADCRTENSRLGYFAALYRKVTVRVQNGIIAGEFEDNPRMEKLDVIFANRYLEAYHRLRNEQKPTRSWAVSFEAGEQWRPLLIQHLLLGMNAHINLDLGIAAKLTQPAQNLNTLKADFVKINEILMELLDGVQEKINTVSPLFGLVDKVGGKTDEAIMNFSIKVARDGAWSFANELAASTEDGLQELISKRDLAIERIADIVLKPGKLLQFCSFFIRLFESNKVSRVINLLF